MTTKVDVPPSTWLRVMVFIFFAVGRLTPVLISPSGTVASMGKQGSPSPGVEKKTVPKYHAPSHTMAL
jgi:hypothetical protein